MGESGLRLLLSLLGLLCMFGFILAAFLGQVIVCIILFLVWRLVLIVKKVYDE